MCWSFSLSHVDLIKVQFKMILTFIWENQHEGRVRKIWKKIIGMKWALLLNINTYCETIIIKTA